MKLAIIGLGEVGRCYLETLTGVPGIEVTACERRMSEAATRLVERLGIIVKPEIGPWLQEADWILSSVVGTVSLDVARQCASVIKVGANFADFTTAAPGDKRSAANLFEGRNGYVDVAIMGAIALLRTKTPLLCSGSAANAFVELFAKAGCAVRAIENSAAGDAMSLKILRSVFTKGMEALAVELLMAAERQGLRAQLYEVLSDVDEARLPAFLEMLVSTHVIHARRRQHEVEEAERQMAAIGIVSDVLDGVVHRFERTAEQLDSRPLPFEQPSIKEALSWLSDEAAVSAA
jgi:3-hydroxyisobutyrate dehydrogenase